MRFSITQLSKNFSDMFIFLKCHNIIHTLSNSSESILCSFFSRVSLTYRVKSAHKLKLTDKQLLQWLFPILLVMAIYLGTWTISSPPEAVYIKDWDDLKFKQCDYNWWDHSLAIGEF